jgi:hypothetical protein
MKHLKTFENFSNTEINEEINWKEFTQKIGFTKDPAKKRKLTIDTIMNHPAKKKVYEQWLKKDKEIAEKYVEFWIENPSATYCRWDEKSKKFVDTGISSDPSGLLGTRSYESKKYK